MSKIAQCRPIFAQFSPNFAEIVKNLQVKKNSWSGFYDLRFSPLHKIFFPDLLTKFHPTTTDKNHQINRYDPE
jgi:hypothetical protein